MKFGREKVEKAIEYVKNFEVEVPSWVFGNFGGGRFGNYTPPGFARNIFEKIDDAVFVHNLTVQLQNSNSYIMGFFF
jgi:Predicted sugar isomerase